MKAYLGWALSISRKIVRTAPVPVFLVVATTLVSQLSLLLAFLLPLKIILLIGSSGIPRYFPQSFAAFDREALVLGLGVATIGFYVLHLLAERATAFCNERAAGRVLARAAKLTLFANQDAMARGAIRKLARAMAAAIFILAALVLIAFIHPTVAFVLVGWSIAAFVAASLAGALSGAFRAWLEANAAAFIGSMTSIGFFVVVASIIAEFLLGLPFHVLYAVVSLILSRQVLQRLSASLKDALALNTQKAQINALFFQGHALAVHAPQRDEGLWDLCRPGRLGTWLPPLLAEATGRPVRNVRMTKWRETGLTDVLVFEVSATDAEDGSADHLVKLFSDRRRTLAAHEAVLLSSVSSSDFPCLPLLDARRIGEADCHLFPKPETRRLRAGQVEEKANRLLQACWLHEPPEELVRRYRRSHQLLAQRLSATMGDRLIQVALTPQNKRLVRNFIDAVDRIKEQLEAVPLFVYCPETSARSLLELKDGRVVASEWGLWSLEPVGAGWPTAKSALAAIGPWLRESRASRPALAAVTAEQVQLAALAFAFQRHYARQRYNSALRLLPAMLACADEAGMSDAGRAAPEQARTALKKTGS